MTDDENLRAELRERVSEEDGVPLAERCGCVNLVAQDAT